MVGVVGAVLVAALTLGLFAGSMKWLPGGAVVPDPDKPTQSVYRWPSSGPLSVDIQLGIVNDWARWNYTGLEGNAPTPSSRASWT